MRCSLLRGVRTIMALAQLPEQEGRPFGGKSADLKEDEVLRIASRVARAEKGGKAYSLSELVTRSAHRSRSGKRFS